jgi:putative transposase
MENSSRATPAHTNGFAARERDDAAFDCFADEARFGRINRPRPCWAPIGIRPEVASQLIREYIYLYGAVSPKDGTCVYLIMPRSDRESFQAFLNVLSRKFARQDILLILDGAPNHRSSDLVVPGNISLLFLPPYSPELNPKENLWKESREKLLKNYALKSIDAVRAKLEQAILYVERNPDIVKSIPSFPYIRNSW